MRTTDFSRIFILSFAISIIFSYNTYSQLDVRSGLSGTELANILTGGGLTIFNVNLDCPGGASGSFSDGNTTNIGLNEGVLLTSGCITVAPGPNNQANAGCNNNAPGDADLQSLTTGATFDRCVLEFDLIPIGNRVTFRYVFASEEYPEFVCSQFNDVFGFFVSGPGIAGKVNIAQIPGTTLSVAINNVNPGSVGARGTMGNCTPPNGSLAFSSFYVNNTANSIQYDGFTVVLTATIDLTPCQTYRFKLGIADVGDRIYDSGVFIEAGSFTSNAILATGAVTRPLCPGSCDGSIDVSTSGGTPPYTFAWSNGRTTEDISGLCAGNYSVIITDVNGCRETLNFFVPNGIDPTPPVIACPSSITVNNDPGVCGAVVNFTPTATDNCTNPTPVVSNPPSGALFPVGITFVNSVATDGSGNSSACSFSVTVRDNERPVVSCPAGIDLSCEILPVPANTGMPGATDNCAVGHISHSDNVTPGDCPGEFVITRTWLARDIHGNSSNCTQVINVFDNTPPVITCPKDTVLICDIDPATAAGVAKATDNCDPSPFITHSDKVLSGDCDWLCMIERTWKVTDNCSNVSSCIQTIEKNTLPLIEDALSLDLDGDGAADSLIMGFTNNTLSIGLGSAHCLLKWLPGTGGTPSGLRRGNQVANATTCAPGGNEVDASGHLTNPLLAEGIKLAIYLRLHPDFGETLLSDFDCEIAPIVFQFLESPNPKVKDLMRITHLALANLVLVPHLNELLEVLVCINGPIAVCD